MRLAARAFSLAVMLACWAGAFAAPATVRVRTVAVEPARETRVDPGLEDVGRQLVAALGEKNAYILVGSTHLALSPGEPERVPVDDGLFFEVTLEQENRNSVSLELVLKERKEREEIVHSRMGVELGSKPFFVNTRVRKGLRVAVFDRR